jgi:superfamily II DNA or RNA helicase
MTVNVKGAFFTPQYRMGLWDGKIRLFNAKYKTFLTGFKEEAKAILEEAGYKVRVQNVQIIPKCDMSMSLSLDRKYFHEGNELDVRWYQREALEAAFEKKRGVIKAPTGSGKTLIAMLLYYAFGTKTLVIVNKKDLLYQTADAFKENKIITGVWGDAKKTDGQAVIATIQTMNSQLKTKECATKQYLAQFGLIIGDEVHHTSDNTYYKALAACTGTPYRIGMSATPLKRKDAGDKFLIGCFGEIIYSVDSKSLSDEGYLANPKIEFTVIETPDLSSVTSYHTAYDLGIVNNEYRNQIIIQKAMEYSLNKMPVLILVKTLDHGAILRDMFALEKKDVPFLKGETDMETRQAAKKIKPDSIMIASPIWNEGVNIPNIRAMIIASGGKSDIQTLQRVGRGMRPKKDFGNEVKVIDFLDRNNKYLTQHSKRRIEALVMERYAVNVYKEDKLVKSFGKRKTRKVRRK